jgi:hypothetical protein
MDRPVPSMEHRGDPVFYGKEISQDIKIRSGSSFFPEKIDCILDLTGKKVTQETTLDIQFVAEDLAHCLGNAYGEIPAYGAISWDQPRQVHGMYKGTRFPLDRGLSVECQSFDFSFQTFQEGSHTIASNNMNLPYGGMPQSAAQSVGLDTVTQTNLYWMLSAENNVTFHEYVNGKTFGDCVSGGVIVLRILAKNIRQKIYDGQSLDKTQQSMQNQDLLESEIPVFQEYTSDWYTMIDDKTMRVTFAPKQ